MRKPLSLIPIALFVSMLLTVSEVAQAQRPKGECLVPCSEIVSGGPRKDGIPALSDPRKLDADDARWMQDEDMVLGVERDGEACAYPLSIFFWHEIVNDNLGSKRSSITYCPLTGTGMHFDASTPQGPSDFGVSGSLWSSNLIMYNRSGEESWWSQMMGKAIVGPEKGKQLKQLPVVETTWGTWKKLKPRTKVLSNKTGFVRDYTVYPYGDYENPKSPPIQSFINFKYIDSRLLFKARVLGVPGTDGKSKAYPFEELAKQWVINDTYDGIPILIVYHPDSRMALAFERQIKGQTFVFEKIPEDVDNLEPFAIRDVQTGSRWNVLGEAISGPLAGVKLKQDNDAIVAFWFAWGAFYPGAEIYRHGTALAAPPEEIDDQTIPSQSHVEPWKKFTRLNKQ